MIPSVRSWWYGSTTSERFSGADITSSSKGISSSSTSVANYDRDTTPTQDTIEDYDTDCDMPPAFPSPYSIQRVGPTTPASPPAISISSVPAKSANKLMPPPSRIPPIPNTLRAPSSRDPSNSSLKLPPSTTRPPSAVKREKVALAPGHSPLDWAKLKTSGQDLRGVTQLARITPSQLKTHNMPDDAWASFNGKVYNITPYLSFHPGGEKQIMRAAGRDGTKLFALTHAWVNVEIMLDECLVGFLVPEPSSAA